MNGEVAQMIFNDPPYGAIIASCRMRNWAIMSA